MAFDPQFLLTMPPIVTHQRYDKRDVMLYAAAVGAGHQGEDADLALICEDGLRALPAMAVVLATPGFWQMEPQYGIDWQRVLHAEQSVTWEHELPVEAEVRSELTVDAIIDKGAAKGALLYWSRHIYDEADDRLLATLRYVSFLRGDGGKGGSGDAAPVPPYPIPDRAPDRRASAQTRREQALLYRLCGDYNPLHSDPRVAHKAGLDRPILHGLCTYGFAGRMLQREVCANDSARVKRIDARFSAPVLPGDTLDLEIWNEGPGRAAYRVTARERNVVAINNGYMEFTG